MKPSSATPATTTRTHELTRQLKLQREETWQALRQHVQEARLSEGPAVCDDAEASEADVQSDLGAALMQMETETLSQIDSALERVAAGTYGRCVECDSDISAVRLRALPFAIRCRECADAQERRHTRMREAWHASYHAGS